MSRFDFQPPTVADIRDMLKACKPFTGENYHVPVHPASSAGRYFRRYGYNEHTQSTIEAAIQRRLSHAKA